MTIPILEGSHVRLEPLTLAHLPTLEQIALGPGAPQIWRYMTAAVKTSQDFRAWANYALKLASTGTGMPWVTILKSSSPAEPDRIVGSTRFIDLDLHHLTTEIGHTWIDPALHRTGINPEAKLLQLTYAFETLRLHRVAFKTHHENIQSQTAIRKLGAQYEGTFRNHYIMPDGSARHSVWFAITAEEWPQVKTGLQQRLNNLNRH